MKLSTIAIAFLGCASSALGSPLLPRQKKSSSSTISVATSSEVSSSSLSANYTQTISIADAATTTDSILSVAQGKYGALFKPKVMIVNMFKKEETRWISNLELKHNISVPMLSPEYPYVHSNANFSIMSVTTGEGEINAAATISSLVMSPLFDLTETYFLISGIAGGSPEEVTVGSVTFAKYAVQVGLAYEIDSREIPADWPYGYISLGTDEINEYPINIYGSEIFELNENLLKRAMKLASNVTLNNGTAGNVAIRQKYNKDWPAYQSPKIVECDTATSDVYWTGEILAKAMGDYVSTVSNNTAKYCSTQQEDNASLEAMVRAAKHGIIDYNRIVISRSISDFERPPTGLNATEFFFNTSQGGSAAALDNLYIAGLPFVQDVLANWDSLYKDNKFAPTNYIGDYLETLGGTKNFGKTTHKIA